MRGYEVIADRLVDAGVDTIFGLMGAGNLDLVPHWVHELGRRYVAARHDSAALAMASGYSGVSGRVGVCTVTHGPGVTNALTALTTAARARHRVPLVAGELAPAARLVHNQRIDQRAVVTPSGAAFIELESPERAAGRLAAALAILEAGQGPVVLNCASTYGRRTGR
jgi:acetolactate synthase-1/2/3 large subunit